MLRTSPQDGVPDRLGVVVGTTLYLVNALRVFGVICFGRTKRLDHIKIMRRAGSDIVGRQLANWMPIVPIHLTLIPKRSDRDADFDLAIRGFESVCRISMSQFSCSEDPA